MALSLVKYAKAYGCTAGPRRRACGRVCVTAAGLERFAVGEVASALAEQPALPEGAMEAEAALGQDKAQLVALTRRRFVERGELAVGEEEYRASKRLLDARIALNRRELRRLMPPGYDLAAKCSAELALAVTKAGGLSYQRELLQVVIDRVVVQKAPSGPGTTAKRVFDPARVEIFWRCVH